MTGIRNRMICATALCVAAFVGVAGAAEKQEPRKTGEQVINIRNGELAVSKVPSISVVLSKDADAVHQRIARVFETQLYQRCGARVEYGTGGDIVGERSGRGLRRLPIHTARYGIPGDIMTRKRPATPSIGQEQGLPIPRSVIECPERPTAVVGPRLSGKSRIRRADGGRRRETIQEIPVKSSACRAHDRR